MGVLAVETAAGTDDAAGFAHRVKPRKRGSTESICSVNRRAPACSIITKTHLERVSCVLPEPIYRGFHQIWMLELRHGPHRKPRQFLQLVDRESPRAGSAISTSPSRSARLDTHCCCTQR